MILVLEHSNTEQQRHTMLTAVRPVLRRIEVEDHYMCFT